MHVVENKRTYYLVDRNKGKTFEIGDYSDLIEFVASKYNPGVYGLEDVKPYHQFDFSGNDKSLQPVEHYGWHKTWAWVDGELTRVEKYGIIRTFEFRSKPYMVIDDTGVIVDVRLFDADIRAAHKCCGAISKRGTTKDAVYGEVRYARHWRMWQRKGGELSYRFRQGSVPCIHSHKGRSYTTKSHIAQLWKNKENLRPKCRVDWVDLWDGKERHTDRSWKSSCKVRHQWQKHQK